MPKGHRGVGNYLGASGGYYTGGSFSTRLAQVLKSSRGWADVNPTGLVLNLDATDLASYPGSGTTWYDLSSSALNATGGSAISSQTLQANQPYTTATTGVLNTDTHSLFFSMQINNTTGSWDKIFGYTPAGTDRSPGIWRWPSNRTLHWRFDPGNTGPNITATGVAFGDATSGTEFTINTWYYVGVTKNGGTVNVYVNGVNIGSGTGITNPKTAGTSTIQIYPGYGGSSAMKHVHAYNRVLSDAEVLANFNAIRGKLGI